MMLDPQADLGRRAWLPCPYCSDNGPLYVLDFDVNLVWVQCRNCLRRWWHDTGVGHRKHPEHLFDIRLIPASTRLTPARRSASHA